MIDFVYLTQGFGIQSYYMYIYIKFTVQTETKSYGARNRRLLVVIHH